MTHFQHDESPVLVKKVRELRNIDSCYKNLPLKMECQLAITGAESQTI